MDQETRLRPAACASTCTPPLTKSSEAFLLQRSERPRASRQSGGGGGGDTRPKPRDKALGLLVMCSRGEEKEGPRLAERMSNEKQPPPSLVF